MATINTKLGNIEYTIRNKGGRIHVSNVDVRNLEDITDVMTILAAENCGATYPETGALKARISAVPVDIDGYNLTANKLIFVKSEVEKGKLIPDSIVLYDEDGKLIPNTFHITDFPEISTRIQEQETSLSPRPNEPQIEQTQVLSSNKQVVLSSDDVRRLMETGCKVVDTCDLQIAYYTDESDMGIAIYAATTAPTNILNITNMTNDIIQNLPELVDQTKTVYFEFNSDNCMIFADDRPIFVKTEMKNGILDHKTSVIYLEHNDDFIETKLSDVLNNVNNDQPSLGDALNDLEQIMQQNGYDI